LNIGTECATKAFYAIKAQFVCEYNRKMFDFLPPHYLSAAELAWERIRVRDGLMAAMLAGSVVDGNPGPTSDLDFFVIVDGDERQRCTWVLDGVLVEASFNPPHQIRRYFDEHDRATMAMLSRGRVLLDHPVLQDLRKEATDRIAADLALVRCVEALFQLRGWWPAKPKRLLAVLRDLDPNCAEALTKVNHASDSRDRQAALEAFAELALGSVEPFEWESSREKV
jgi:predicted nucleotidyltransferase